MPLSHRTTEEVQEIIEEITEVVDTQEVPVENRTKKVLQGIKRKIFHFNATVVEKLVINGVIVEGHGQLEAEEDMQI